MDDLPLPRLGGFHMSELSSNLKKSVAMPRKRLISVDQCRGYAVAGMLPPIESIRRMLSGLVLGIGPI